MIKETKQNNNKSKIPKVIGYIVYSFIMFIQWSPPGFYDYLAGFRWYLMLFVSVLLFLPFLDRRNTPIKFLLFFYFLSFMGILLSLFRTKFHTQTLYTAVSLLVPFVLGFALSNYFSEKLGKKIFVITLIAAAFLWAINIINMWYLHGENIRKILVGRGLDHNIIALNLGTATIIFLVTSLYGKFSEIRVINNVIIITLIAITMVLYLLTFFTYSRSGFITTSISILLILFTLLLNYNFLKFISVLLFLLGTLIIIVPVIQITNPVAIIKFSELLNTNYEATSLFTRSLLFEKAIFVISENPVVGIGPGAFVNTQYSYYGMLSYKLPHNTYLKTWAEYGMFGILGYIVWIIKWLQITLFKWKTKELTQKILLSMYIPFFVMLLFLDLGGISHLSMLTVFSVINNESKKNF